MGIKLLILCFLGSFLNPGENEQVKQNSQPFDKEVTHLYFELFSRDSDEGFRIADSLYRHSDDPLRKAGARMLGASILGKENKHLKAIQYAKEAIASAREINNYSIQIFMWQSIVQFYARYGFYDKAEAALQKGMELVPKIKNKERNSYYKGMMIKAQGHLAIARGDYKKAIASFKEAIRHFEVPNHPDSAFRTSLTRTYQLLGEVLCREGDLERALKAYYKGEQYMEFSTSLDARYAGRIYEGLADVYLKKNKIDSARVNLQRGMEIAHSNVLKDYEFTERIYRGWMEYYHRTKQSDSLTYYHEAYNKISREREIQSRVIVNGMMNYILQEEESRYDHEIEVDTEEQKAEEKARIWWIAGGLGVLGGVFFLCKQIPPYVAARKKRLYKEKAPDIVAADHKESLGKKEKGASLSETAIENMKEKLQEFEREMKFLDPEMSFPTMAGILETNTKYLNIFLTRYLDTNYITYINDKRIDYILKQLQEDQKCRAYKLTHLAEKSGFSSYSTLR